MIAYIEGKIVDVAEDNLILEANHIGYNIRISTETAGRLPAAGEEVRIYTYTYVREDDLEIFKKLITVNKIGPKGGLAILSVMTADDLRFAILAGDAKAIAKAPGVGIKTAERVILDLRDKVSMEDSLVNREAAGMADASGRGKGGNDKTAAARQEAAEALAALGYSPAEAMKAVKEAEITDGMDAEDILKQALKKLL